MQKKQSINRRIIYMFLCASLILFSTNFILDRNLNRIISQMNQVYETNVQLNEFSETITRTNQYLYQYLYLRGSSSLESFYQSEKVLQDIIDRISVETPRNKEELMMTNLCNLARSYVLTSEEAVLGKRSRNIQRYRESYEKGNHLLDYIQTYTNTLGAAHLKNNSMQYEDIRSTFRNIEIFSICFAVIILLIQIIIILIMTKNITRPLILLSKAADEISEGNFDKEFVIVQTGDEIETLSKAVHKMVDSIRTYSYQVQMGREKELLMEKHLADARLQYLQSQINPHFLFSSLNTGMQLAVLEDAERTSSFIEKLADFYRYNIGKKNDVSTLRDEVEYVDYYMYIMDVRYTGTIHYTKNIEQKLLVYRMPPMILQPIVENAVRHGIEGRDNIGDISLCLTESGQNIEITIEDNGIGITEDKIKEIMGNPSKEDREDENNKLNGDGNEDSNGIGLQNIISRLELYFDSKREELFRIESDDNGTRVVLTLPKVRNGERNVSDTTSG